MRCLKHADGFARRSIAVACDHDPLERVRPKSLERLRQLCRPFACTNDHSAAFGRSGQPPFERFERISGPHGGVKEMRQELAVAVGHGVSFAGSCGPTCGNRAVNASVGISHLHLGPHEWIVARKGETNEHSFHHV